MDFGLSQEELELRANVTAFARQSLRRHDGASGECFRRELWEACAGFGLLGLPVPEQYGGSDLGIMPTTVAMEALGYGCDDHGLLFSLHAHMWAVIMPIMGFGTEAQKARWLPGLVDGSLIGAHGMSEPDSGTDAFSLRTRASRDGDAYVLNGTKTFVTNAPVAELFIVFATVNPGRGMWGVTAFVIEKDTPGLQVSAPFRKLGLRSSPMAEVVLEDCRVPAEQRLGQEGQGAALFNHSMGWERSCILASQVGRMEAQLEQCVSHATQRRQFGRAIGSFQLVASRIADMKVRLETSRLLLYRTAWQHEVGADPATYSAMAKLYISEAAVQSALSAVQVHGGYGYMEEYSAERELRDAVGGTLYSGTSEIQRMLIARQLGLSPS
jgi:alkylation response protein AidB-like acyl-CoA dehydrogenase